MIELLVMIMIVRNIYKCSNFKTKLNFLWTLPFKKKLLKFRFILIYLAFSINVTVYNSLADYFLINEELIIYIHILFWYTVINSGFMFEFCRIILKVKLKNFNFERDFNFKKDSNFSKEELIFYYIIAPVYCVHLIATLTSLLLLSSMDYFSKSFILPMLVAPAECFCFYCFILDEEDLKNEKIYVEITTALYKCDLVYTMLMPFVYVWVSAPFEREGYFLYKLIKKFVPRSSPILRYILRTLVKKLISFITYFCNLSIGKWFLFLKLFLGFLFYVSLLFKKHINQNSSFYSRLFFHFSFWLWLRLFSRLDLKAVCNNLKNFFFDVIILAACFMIIFITIFTMLRHFYSL